MAVNVKNGFLKVENKWNNQELDQPLQILILNLMPTKEVTERQFLNILAVLNQDVEVTFLYPQTHHFKTVDQDRVAKCYCSLQDVYDNYYDGLIITGAPVEQLDFQDVDYWNEFLAIKQWSTNHVGQTINECWASQAALYCDFAIPKTELKQKLFGIYQASSINPNCRLCNNLSRFVNPQSRHSQSLINRESLPTELTIVADNQFTGPLILHSDAKRQTYLTGHPEYSLDTLDTEYHRDLAKNSVIDAPANYYDRKHQIENTWQNSSIQLYQNWVDLIESEEFNYDRKAIAL
ncbi:homoserine O-succinyltransferase [Lactobacillus sp. Sy-1]|uniref:homoserine O-acetyltransferase/O-succinyltransferase family protein n=1 Tax=Lactobacillus sp. Sy-1 TaxID=2109645 RepID=UPI001C5ADA61|nr:homoserine O-succinyltransferase [Lactobacillus sp. Sy-1]MBW1606428.1 homoserine O-succinyltransferase [Lactobacillus sp. Sy-1]